VRWDSPFVLAAAGTAAIHLIVLVAADAVALTHPLLLDPPAPHVRMIDVKIQPRRVLPAPHHEEAKAIAKTEPPRTRPVHVQQVAATHADPVIEKAVVTQTIPDSSPAGGTGPVVAMDDIAPAAEGIPVAKRQGAGGVGSGGGAGTATGSGSGSGSAAPVSVATIKQLAMPKSDYGYVLSKDYPAEAKRLEIEGTLKVRLVVDTSGKVISATLLDHLGHGLDELALAQARTFEFTPARDGEDRPVTSVVVWTFRMTPPK